MDQNSFKDFLLFRRMLAPIAIQVIFWIFVVIWVGMGIWLMTRKTYTYTPYYGGYSPYSTSGGSVLGGLLLIIIGPVISRIYAEFLIVVFRIYEELKKVNHGGFGPQDIKVGTINPGRTGTMASTAFNTGPLTTNTSPSAPTVETDSGGERGGGPTSIFCPECGGENDGSLKFCIKCGKKLK